MHTGDPGEQEHFTKAPGESIEEPAFLVPLPGFAYGQATGSQNVRVGYSSSGDVFAASIPRRYLL